MRRTTLAFTLMIPAVAAAMTVILDGRQYSNVKKITVMDVTAPPVTPPPVVPPPVTGCKGDLPYQVQPLPTGLKRYAMSGGSSLAFKFTTPRFSPAGAIGFVGEPAPQAPLPSPKTSANISLCPGDFTADHLGKPGLTCATGGRDGAVRVRVLGLASYAECKLLAGKDYYFNIAPVNLATLKPTCSVCGVTISSSRSRTR